ncbi:MAG: WYL domain-containing protein [Xanthomonadales bacterium]|nr:WYL domain-containing protein [Xanthomonadales bacterium]
MSYESLIRVLGAIPPTGWHSTREIHDRAKDNEHEVTRRTMERTLDALLRSPQPPIEMRGGEGPGKAKEWRWKRNHPLKDHAHHEAVLVERLLLHRLAHHLLPPATAQRLNEDARAALGEVAAKPDSNAAWWTERVLALPPGPQRFPRKLDAGVFDAVSTALWKRRQLKIEYRNRTETGWREQTVHPQGLVQDGYLFYLVAVAFDYPEVRHYSLTRMRNPEVLPAPSRVIEDPNFADHVAKQFHWPFGEPKPITFLIHTERKIELEELPISLDQVIDPVPNEEGYHRVTATLAWSLRFEAFLKSFGDQAIWDEKQ